MAESVAQGNLVAGGRGRRRERNCLLPKVRQIMKKALPAAARIDKEAETMVQECVTEFIYFITSEADIRCKKDNRKRLNGDDIIGAMTYFEFDNYVEPLKIYLDKIRAAAAERRTGSVPVETHHQIGDDDGQDWIFVDAAGVSKNSPAIVLTKFY